MGNANNTIQQHADRIFGRSEKFSDDDINRIIGARFDSRLPGVMQRIYPDAPALRRGHTVFPVAVHPAPPGQMEHPESVLAKPLVEAPVDINELFLQVSGWVPIMMERLGYGLQNLPVYAITKYELAPEIKIHCGLATYFETMATCDSLAWEAWFAMQELAPDETPPENVRKQSLLIRNEAHNFRGDAPAYSGEPYLDTTGRSSPPAVSCAVIFNREHEYAVLAGKRVLRGIGRKFEVYHAAPSGIFQPAGNGTQEDFNITNSVFREYLEELFCFPEHEHSEAESSTPMEEDPNYLFVQSLLERGDARFIFTGLAFDFATLRPEICTALIINTPEWYATHLSGRDDISPLTLNWEWKNGAGSTPDIDIAAIPVKQAEKILKPDNSIATGAACIFMGIDQLKK